MDNFNRQWDVSPWFQPMNQAVHVVRACGAAIVEWPSGLKTLEQFIGTAVASDLEVRYTQSSDALFCHKLQNLDYTMFDWQQRTAKRGYWIREKRRKKARRVVNVQWLKPSDYHGPAPFWPTNVIAIASSAPAGQVRVLGSGNGQVGTESA